MNRSIGVLAVAVSLGATAFISGIASSQTVPSSVTVKPVPSQKVQAAAAAAQLRGRPRRVVRLPESVVVSQPPDVRQDVVAGRVGATIGGRAATFSPAFWITGASGDIRPHGTITLRGRGFGSSVGDVHMLGTFPHSPDGIVELTVSSWSDSSVTASIPAISGAPDQSVRITLVTTTRGISNDRSRPIAVTTAVSNDVAMRFVADRETILARAGWVVNSSCGDNIGNAFTRDNEDICNSWHGLPGGSNWDILGTGDYVLTADHLRPHADATGDDAYQTQLPAGWSFDRIEFAENSSGTSIDLAPTIDATHVSWLVHWKTAHVADRLGPHEEAAYALATYVTGPLGTGPR